MKLTSLLLLCFACYLIWFIPDTIHFRDSGEFHLVAHYLDIAHPAGFPVYATFCNLFSLLPLGPIVWRTHLFSTVIIILWLYTIAYLVNMLREKYFPKSPAYLTFFAILPLLTSFPIWKSAFTAEVYGLHALFLTLATVLYLQFLFKKDFRYLALLSVVAVLTLGNHVASAIIFIPLAVIWGYKKIPFSFCLGLSLTTSFLVFLLYLYIPLRSQTPLPLSSGAPSTISRFFSVITNERDRALRPRIETNDETTAFVRISSTFSSDILRLSKELPRYTSFLGILGFGFLFLASPRIAGTFFVIFIGTMLFFAGWDTDPWLPAFGILSILGTIPILGIIHHLSGQYTRQSFSLLVCLSLAFLSYTHLKDLEIQQMTSDRSAETTAKATLHKIPSNGVFFVEPSWFLLRSHTLLEGLREDITLINIPGFLFPKYFNPINIKNSSESFDASMIQSENDFEPGAPAIKNIGRLINLSCNPSSCIFEPHLILSQILKEVLILDMDGTAKLHPNEQHKISNQYLPLIIDNINQLKNTGCSNCRSLTYDRWNYAEVIANSQSDLLLQTGHPEEARTILETLCNTPQKLRCSHVSVKNLLMLSSHNKESCKYLDFLMSLVVEQPRVAKPVLELQKVCDATKS